MERKISRETDSFAAIWFTSTYMVRALSIEAELLENHEATDFFEFLKSSSRGYLDTKA